MWKNETWLVPDDTVKVPRRMHFKPNGHKFPFYCCCWEFRKFVCTFTPSKSTDFLFAPYLSCIWSNSGFSGKVRTVERHSPIWSPLLGQRLICIYLQQIGFILGRDKQTVQCEIWLIVGWWRVPNSVNPRLRFTAGNQLTSAYIVNRQSPTEHVRRPHALFVSDRVAPIGAAVINFPRRDWLRALVSVADTRICSGWH